MHFTFGWKETKESKGACQKHNENNVWLMLDSTDEISQWRRPVCIDEFLQPAIIPE